MSWATFEHILQGLRAWRSEGNPVKVIYLHGIGEPLTNPQIVDMIHIIKKEQLCREVRLVTNGSLLTPQLNQRLIDAGVYMLRVSIEAFTVVGYQELCGINIDFSLIVEHIRDFTREAVVLKAKCL